MIKLHYPGFSLRLDPVHSAVKSRGRKEGVPRDREQALLISKLYSEGRLVESQRVILEELLKQQEKTATPKDMELSVKYADRKLPTIKLYRLSFSPYQAGWYYFALSSNQASRRNSIKNVRPLAATLEEAIECAKNDAITLGVQAVTANYPKVK